MLTILVVIGFSGSPFLVSCSTEEICWAKKKELMDNGFWAFCLPITADKTPYRKLYK